MLGGEALYHNFLSKLATAVFENNKAAAKSSAKFCNR
jgi:hypothetical protein